MTLKTGTSYDLAKLTHTGWTDGDGSGHEGYNVADYFTTSGEYKGPDECGLEPTFEEAQSKFLRQIAAEQAKLDTARAFLKIHGERMGEDFPGTLMFTDKPLLYVFMPYHGRTEENRQRMLVRVGEVFGREGWTRHTTHQSAFFEWRRTIDGVQVQVDEAESTLSPLEGSPVMPRLFPLQLAAPAPDDEEESENAREGARLHRQMAAPPETSISDNGTAEDECPF